MTQKREFDRLEQFVKKMLVQFDQLRIEKTQLESLVGEKEQEIAELREELVSADSARGDISSRVKGLIEQIEEWEADLDQSDKILQGTDSEIGPVNEEDDKETGPQQNLFNVEPRITNLDG